MEILRTPDERFRELPGFGWSPKYVDDLPGFEGLRIHYLDEGPRDSAVTALCLHGNPSWAYLYRHMIPVFAAAGLRVVAPDLIGFGRSDKPADPAWHTFDKHRSMLMRFIERLDLKHLLLVCQDWGGLLGLTLPHEMPGRFARLLVMNTGLGTGQVTEGFRQWRAYSNSQADLPGQAVGARQARPECRGDRGLRCAVSRRATQGRVEGVSEHGARRQRCAGRCDQPSRGRVLAQ
ncbi:MAG TPA: alpha/beta fold hydrolase [Burkholderiaceae bacterium]|nr:alpha/beta fold hydrolase [Burkholderiaceae bacterium]